MIALYLLANVAYLVALPLDAIQGAPSDRVATATLDVVFPGFGAAIMAVFIMVSTFGCNNGLILAGARACYAMARDGLFFAGTGRLNAARVPARALVLQGMWAALLILPRTFDAATGRYGNLYSNLLDAPSAPAPSRARPASAASIRRGSHAGMRREKKQAPFLRPGPIR